MSTEFVWLCEHCPPPENVVESKPTKHRLMLCPKCGKVNHYPATVRTAAVYQPPGVRRTDPDTSVIAAAAMDGEPAASQRRRIIEAVKAAGFSGRHHAELNALFGWNNAQADRRLVELRRAGELLRLKRTRPTPSDCPAHVYIHPDFLRHDDEIFA